MFPFYWLSTLQKQYRSRFRQSTRARQHGNRHACTPCIARATPRHAVELLEDRMLLTAFTVVNTNDSGEGSLRAAIEAANANAGADTISFDASLRGRTIVLSDELLISDDLTITGLGAGLLTLDGNGDSRIFNIDDGDKNTNITVEISGLTLTNGFAELGAAILNYETLSLSDSIVSENVASSVGGGIYHLGALLTITDTLFADNTAAYGGGIYNVTQDLIISGSTFFRNTASEQGGGIYTLQGVSRYAAHTLQAELYYPILFQPYIRSLDYQFNLITITGTSFSENSANEGGALYSSYISPPDYDLGWCGNTSISSSVLNGAFQSVNTDRSRSEFTISDCTFTANTADHGGAIYNYKGQITITDSLIIANTALNGAGIYHCSGVFTISNSSISGNVAQQSGGGILSGSGLTIENSSITNNKAGYGAGIYTRGNLNINGSTLAHNSALSYGGGIYFYYSSGVILNSTLSANHAGVEGGGIFFIGLLPLRLSFTPNPVADPGLIQISSDTTLSQTSLTGDSLSLSPTPVNLIDPIYELTYCPIVPIQYVEVQWIGFVNDLSMTNCTITGNSAGQSGGGIASNGSHEYSIVTFNNSIIAGNVATSSAQIKGDYSGGFNIIQDSIEGLLDPVLRDNGGPTKTHALLPGSAAINAGDNQAATEAGLTTDQRGGDYQRIYAGTVDIGAVEYHALNLVVDTLSDEDDGDYSSGHLSLREAIKLANQTFDTDQITFSNSLAGGTIMLESELLISTGMHIVGLGQGQITLDGGNNSRIFLINDSDTYSDAGVEISGLSLKHGSADRGGAILNYEDLLLTDVALSENKAYSDGGAIYHAGGQLTVTDSIFEYNQAQINGGGIYNSQQDLIVEETTFYRNTSGAGGGGIYSIYGSKLKHSRPDPLPGPAFPVLRSIYTRFYFLNYGDTEYNVVAILHSSFLENEANSGGGVYMTQNDYRNPLLNCDTVAGIGGTAVVSSQQYADNLSLTGNKIVGCTFAGNTANRGGGLYNDGRLDLSASTFTENRAYDGGGIYHRTGSLTIQNSTVSGNSATHLGGGIYSNPGHPLITESNIPVLEPVGLIPLTSETVSSGNGVSLTTEQVAPDSASFSFDAISTNTLSASDTVISSAADWMFLIRSSTLRIQNSTVTGNSAGKNGGGLYLTNADNSYIRSSNNITNSIIAGNLAPENAQVNSDFSGGFNIIQDSIEGLLDPVLRDNGGPTKTHALLPGSAAINAGDNQAASDAGLTTDQRGEGSQRIKEGTVDIGAFEVQGPFTEVDFRFSTSKTRRLDNGEWERLPGSRVWLDETGNYWLEIWLNTPASQSPGIQSASFNLNYNTTAATALSIEYGAAFTEHQSGTINQDTGTIENLSAETTRADVGDDQYTLFVRIQFHANSVDSIDWERDHHPRTTVINPEIILDQLNIRMTDGAASEVIVNRSPDHPVWINPEPAGNIPDFNDQIPGTLPFNYHEQPDYSSAAANFLSNNEFAYHSGLTLIDLPGSPIEDQENRETDILIEVNSLVGHRDETEEDLPKVPTSAGPDISNEEAADQFFTDLTEATELIVF